MNVQQQFKDVFQPDVTQHPEYKLGKFHYQNPRHSYKALFRLRTNDYLGYGNEFAQGVLGSVIQRGCAQ